MKNKSVRDNNFFRAGLIVFIVSMVVNGDFVGKNEFLSGLFLSGSVALMILGILEGNDKLENLKKRKKYLINKVLK